MNKMTLVENMITERATEARKQKDGDNFAEIPKFKPGDTVIVAVRVVEGEKKEFKILKVLSYQDVVKALTNHF